MQICKLYIINMQYILREKNTEYFMYLYNTEEKVTRIAKIILK